MTLLLECCGAIFHKRLIIPFEGPLLCPPLTTLDHFGQPLLTYEVERQAKALISKFSFRFSIYQTHPIIVMWFERDPLHY